MHDPRLLSGTGIRQRLLAEVAERVKAAKNKHPMGRLVSISIGEHKEVGVCIRNQAKAAELVGIPFEQQLWPGDPDQGNAITAHERQLDKSWLD